LENQNVSIQGSPHYVESDTSRVKRDKKGKVIQRRHYGGDGNAIINIDYDHDHGAGKPHAHDWDWTQDPPVRLPGRSLQESEKKEEK
jgi:hypothetical protein